MSISSRITSMEQHIGNAYDGLDDLGVNLYILPEGYTQLDYIESTGTQYIDTGLIGTDLTDKEIELTIKNNTTGLNKYNFNGAYQVGKSTQMGTVATSNTTCRCSINFGFTDAVGVDGLDITQFHKLYAKDGLQKANNVQIGTKSFGSLNEYSFLLFARTNVGGATTNIEPNAGSSISLFTVKKNGNYIRYLVPCYRNSDNKVGMYDTVTNTFFANQGTGDFIAGQVSRETIDKNIDNISSMLEDVWNEYPKVTETDVEEASINGTKKGRMEIDLKGNTEQFTTTGKNLLPITNTGVTKNGIAYTKNADGTITFNGTATAGSSYNSTINLTLNTGTYTISVPETIPSGFYMSLDNQQYSMLTSSANTKTFTLNEQKTFSQLIIWADSGAVLNNITFHLQLEQGSSATSFEPYTGETASPNPDFPQDVEVVSGENTVKVADKNLFDDSNITFITGVLDDNGNNTGSAASHYTENYFNVVPNTLYTISGTLTSGQGTFRLYYYDKNKNWISRTAMQGTSPFTFTTPINCYYIRIQVVNDVTLQTGDIQLEQSSTATTYEEHKEQDFPINLSSRNLFDKNNVNIYNGYADYNIWVSNASHRTIYIPCKPNTTYTVTKTNKGSNVRFAVITCPTIPKTGTNATDTLKDNSATHITKTTGTDDHYLAVWCYVTNDTGATWQEIIDSIQIEEGSTATEYQPYYNYELCKIGDYQEYIYKNNDNWYIKKKIGKVVFNENAEIYELQSINNYGIANFLLHIVNNYSDQTIYTNMITNYFSKQTTSIANTQTEGFLPALNSYENKLNIYLRIKSSRANTIESMRTWLSTHNTIVYYILETEQDILITDTTLISQLNALEKAKSYDNVTNIIQENNDLPFILDIKTLKKS